MWEILIYLMIVLVVSKSIKCITVNVCSSGECLPCFDGCTLGYGCAGPGKTFNDSNGCMKCDTILLDRSGKQVSH